MPATHATTYRDALRDQKPRFSSVFDPALRLITTQLTGVFATLIVVAQPQSISTGPFLSARRAARFTGGLGVVPSVRPLPRLLCRSMRPVHRVDFGHCARAAVSFGILARSAIQPHALVYLPLRPPISSLVGALGREDCRVDAFRQLVYDIELVDPIPWSPGPTSGHAAAH